MPRTREEHAAQARDALAAGRAVHQRRAAERALDDPAELRRATRIVMAALDRGVITIDELVEPIHNKPGGTDGPAD